MAPNRRMMDPTLPMDPSMEDELTALVGLPDAPKQAGEDDLDRIMAEMLDSMDSLLPKIPGPPGFHTCWLSSTSERDPISQRERWGYTPMLQSELPPGAHAPEVHSSDAGDGCIRVREMVLYKIPTVRAEALYRINHHLRPMQMVDGLDPRRNANLQGLRDRNGTPLVSATGDGYSSELTTPRPAPRFFPIT